MDKVSHAGGVLFISSFLEPSFGPQECTVQGFPILRFRNLSSACFFFSVISQTSGAAPVSLSSCLQQKVAGWHLLAKQSLQCRCDVLCCLEFKVRGVQPRRDVAVQLAGTFRRLRHPLIACVLTAARYSTLISVKALYCQRLSCSQPTAWS